MASNDHLIHYVCTAPAHRRTTELGLTRNSDQWALCPDLLDGGHEWQDVGGLEVGDAVARWRLLVDDDSRSAAA